MYCAFYELDFMFYVFILRTECVKGSLCLSVCSTLRRFIVYVKFIMTLGFYILLKSIQESWIPPFCTCTCKL